MTKEPPQAQIEAAARAAYESYYHRSGSRWRPELDQAKNDWRAAAKAALIAAAECGE